MVGANGDAWTRKLAALPVEISNVMAARIRDEHNADLASAYATATG